MDAPKEVLEDIAREYESTFVLPEQMPSPQWLLMPVGLVGSGKTTVVKRLAAALGLLRISTDEIRKRLKERGYSYEGCRDVAHTLTTKYLSLGYSIAVDGNTGSERGLIYNEKTAEAFPNARQLFIHINPPEEFIRKHLYTPERAWLYRDEAHASSAFEKNKAEFVVPNLPFVYTFDTSQDDFETQIEEGAEALRQALQTKI